MKITKARVQQIIAEEYQRTLYEGALADKAKTSATKQQVPEQPVSKEKDVRNRSELAMMFKTEIAPIVQKASGITGVEPQILKDLVGFIINVLNKKSVDPKKADMIKSKIVQTVGQVK